MGRAAARRGSRWRLIKAGPLQGAALRASGENEPTETADNVRNNPLFCCLCSKCKNVPLTLFRGQEKLVPELRETYVGFQVFKADSSKWLDFGAANGKPTWLEVELPERRWLTSYSLCSANDFPERDPCDFTLEASEQSVGQGSDAQLTWAVLDAQEGLKFAARFEARHFTVCTQVSEVHATCQSQFCIF